MSFKNLNDALHASGHSGRNRDHAPDENKRCRRQAKAALHNVDIHCDEQPDMPRESRYHPRKYARTLLLDRWLKQQVGRPFTEVYSDLRKHIGPITTPQAHQLHENIEWDIARSDVAVDCSYDFEIDENGNFIEFVGLTYNSLRRPSYQERDAWSRGRKLFVVDGEHWWCAYWRYDRQGVRKRVSPMPLSPEDLEFFHSLRGIDQSNMKIKRNRRYAKTVKALHTKSTDMAKAA